MLKVGIMQPYFVPYIGYFSLAKHVDLFIVLDDVQFIRHGWVDRNRIMRDRGGWTYIRASLAKYHHNDLIKDIRIDNGAPWKNKILSQIVAYKKTAPYYYSVRKLLVSVFEKDFEYITDLNIYLLECILKYIGVDKSIAKFSQMNLMIQTPTAPDEWALNICQALGNVAEYWNPPGGKEFFDPLKYASANIALRFHSPTLKEYDQRTGNFEPGLSIIDVLMFNSPETVYAMLDNFFLL